MLPSQTQSSTTSESWNGAGPVLELESFAPTSVVGAGPSDVAEPGAVAAGSVVDEASEPSVAPAVEPLSDSPPTAGPQPPARVPIQIQLDHRIHPVYSGPVAPRGGSSCRVGERVSRIDC